MRKKIFVFTTVAILLSFFSPSLHAQGYEIDIEAKGFGGESVILAEYFTTRMIPKDTLVLDAQGTGTFQGNTPLEGGLYVMFFNQNYYFDFLLDKDQEFSIKADSTDLLAKTKFEGSKDNSLFYDYKRYLQDKRSLQESILQERNNAASKEDSIKAQNRLVELNEEISNAVDARIQENEGTFFATFLSAMKDPSPPDELLKGTQRQKDSIKYVYYKNHYFDHFDVGDIRLLHTPFYESKVKNYINKVVPPHPDSIIQEVDFLIEASRSDEAIFRYMLITLFNNFAESKIMGMDKVYFHIADKYYIPEASWSDEEFITKLKDNLEKSRLTFIGETAPNIELKGIPWDHVQMADMDTAIKKDPHIGYTFQLNDITGPYTILYFWEADCGHCKKSTPALYSVYEKYKDHGVKILAVHVINSIEGKVKWIDFLEEHQLSEWINCWSPYSNDYRVKYNLNSFPQMFLLDEDKKIIAKRLTPEQVDDMLGKMLNNE